MIKAETSTKFETPEADCCESCCSPAEPFETKTEPGSSSVFEKTKEWFAPAVSFLMLMTGLGWDHLWNASFFEGLLRLGWYLAAYIPVARPVLKKGYTLLKNGDVFTEFTLMGIATIGAFLIGEYPEGVAVMLFYTVGELFQENAVSRAKKNIRSLLDVRADTAHLEENGSVRTTDPRSISPGNTIQVKPGEKVPLDGELLSETGTFNTSALTGESMPRVSVKGESVLSGMINQDALIRLRVSKPFEESAISKILELIQNASSRKAKTEQFIRRFSRVYTPAVTLLAALLVFIPWFFTDPYVFSDWLYRGLVFLVISCPCALVISIPLGYFGGIGAASKNGILFKGANYLDLMPSVNTVVIDKTGTLTEGKFSVERVVPANGTGSWLFLAAAAEKNSSHP
ncbi:MAG: HAD-IC family P-type ATPase, partial [Balneolaceae bacterium]